MSRADLRAGGKRMSTLDEVRQAAVRLRAWQKAVTHAREQTSSRPWWEPIPIPDAESLTIRDMVWEVIVLEANAETGYTDSRLTITDLVLTVLDWYPTETASTDRRFIEATGLAVLGEVEAAYWDRIRAQVRWTMRQLDRAMKS